MQVEKLRSLIRESIQEYIKEIDVAAEDAAMEARIAKCDEAIQAREAKLGAIAESDHKDLMDEGKIKGLENEIKELKKAKAKFEKVKEKKANKKAGKDKKEVTTDAKMEDTPVDESDVMEKMEMEGDMSNEEALNESFLKMQKLAGVITEAQYNQKKKMLSEGFLDNVAAGLKGKSEQGKLAQQILAKLGITKNPVEIFATGAEKGGAGPFENEVQYFVENGGDINTKIPFSKNIKSSSGGAIFKETYTFDFNKDVPTMKSGGKFIWNIKGGKWEPFGDKDGNENQEEPLDIESMKKESDAEPGTYATEAVMMTIADAAKIWPGGYGERLRDIIAEKSGSQPQQESLARFKKKK